MRARWRAALGFAAIVLGLAGAGPSFAARWLKVESPHFIIYGDAPERELRQYATMLEDFDAVLRTFHGRKLDEPVTRKLPVYSVSSPADFRRVYTRAKPGYAGVYVSGPQDTFAVATRGADGFPDANKGDDTLLHEYVHHFMMQYYPSAYPAWLVEGYAEYFMTADLRGKAIVGNVNSGRAYQLLGEKWLPLSQVLSKQPRDLEGDAIYAYYAEAWLLTHYLMSDLDRRRQLAAYLKAVQSGTELGAAWAAAFGGPPESLNRILRSYLRGPLKGSIIERAWPSPALTVTPLSEGAGEVILERQALTFGLDKPENGSLILETSRAAHARFPGDAFVSLTCGVAETRYGDRVKGEALLEELIAADPRNSEALLALAQSKLEAGEKDGARKTALYREAGRLLTQASKIDPESYQILSRYAQTREVEADFPSENTMNVLLKAISLAPQVEELRLQAGAAAMARKNAQLARALVTPVANDPHGGENAEAARKLLQQVEGALAAAP